VTATVRARRPRIAILATAIALALAATPAAFAQEEGDEPDTGVECDADGLVVELDEDGSGEEYYLVPPGAAVDCVAWGLDDELAIDWQVAIYGLTTADFDDLDGLDDLGDFDEEMDPIVVFPDEGAEAVTSTGGEATVSFTIPSDIVFGWFEGEILQFGEAEEPVYEEYFDGMIAGDLDFFEGEMVCEPDPAPQGAEVGCVAEEMTAGAFEWEVYFLSVDELLDAIFGEGDLAAGDGGSGEADADGTGAFTFEVPVGDHEVYLAVAEQDDYLAIFAGEIGPAAPVTPERPSEPVVDDGAGSGTAKPPVAVARPTRVDAGAGGTAPDGSSPLLALTLGLALTAAFSVRQLARRDR
jgi:hypothetical protein